MEQQELEGLITRLLEKKQITAKEAVGLLKLNIPVIQYRYNDPLSLCKDNSIVSCDNNNYLTSINESCKNTY